VGIQNSYVGAVTNVENCAVSQNQGDGILNGLGQTGKGATIRVSNSIVTDNVGLGFENDDGQLSNRAEIIRGNNNGGAQTGGVPIVVIAGS